MNLQPDQMLSHYRLVEKIGEGGMGVVWKAIDTTLDREVAIKSLPDLMAAEPDRLTRFDREAKLLASLNHPHIASVYGLHEIEGHRFLAMEMIQGEDLSERLRTGPLPVDEALRLARQIAEGLEAAHENGIIHRDLKPANIKLTAEGTVKILDFGLAKALEENVGPGDATQSPTLTAAATRAGMIMGTAAYMSPEQARGQEADKRADIWAFGVVLFEMLGGRRLFDGGTVSDTLASVLMKSPDWESLPEGMPAPMRRLLRRCLQKDVRDRLRDIGDARIVIGEVLHGTGEAEEPAPATSPEIVSQPPWRRLLPWGLAAIFLAAALFSGSRLINQETPETPITRFAQTFSKDNPLALYDQPAVAISPDGRTLAFTVGTFGSTEIWLRDLESLEVRRLSGTAGAESVCFSPDGQWLAFFANGAVKKVAVTGGGSIKLTDSSPNPRGLSWGAPDTILFAPGTSTGLFQVSGSGGPPREVIVPDVEKDERTYRWPELLPGGKGVLFTVGAMDSPEYYDDSPVEVLDLASGERRVVAPGSSMARYVNTGHVIYARSGSLFAVPFDLERLEVTGPPIPVLDGVLSLRNSGAVQFDIADDGTLVYVPGDERRAHRKLVWVDRDGNIEDIPAPLQTYIQPNLSPDGKRIAVVVLGDKTQDIWMYDLERQVMNRLTFDGNNLNPVWSPDGTQILYASSNSSVAPEYTALHILRKPSDGTGQPELVVGDTVQLVPYDISPDGRLLALDRLTAASDVFLYALDGSEEMQPFVTSPFEEWMACFSPDGKYVAYTSDESNQLEVYVRPVSGTSGKWQISIDGGTEPRWSDDGTELFYLNVNKLMKVDVDLSTGFRPGTPRMLFAVAMWGDSGATSFFDVSYDVAPGAERFLLIQPETDEIDLPVAAVVQNWGKELKQKVPKP